MLLRFACRVAVPVMLTSCAGPKALQLIQSASTPTVQPASEPPAEPQPQPIAIADEEPAPAPEPVTSEPREPNPYVAPLVRQAGDLTVNAPPQAPRDPNFIGRMRNHIDGALSKGSPRVWVGPQVPGFVPLMDGTMELFILDRVGDEFMAFYRDPYGAGSCALGDPYNCDYAVHLFDIRGDEQWRVDLGPLLSRPDHLEVQDIRWADGTLYFNEACQSYSREAKGKCSALVAYDPVAQAVLWRTRSLVSNAEFLVEGDYIVSGYGFTSERDFLFVVRRRDGKVVQKIGLKKAAKRLTLVGNDRLEIIVYSNLRRTFTMKGWDTAKPRLVPHTGGRSNDRNAAGR